MVSVKAMDILKHCQNEAFPLSCYKHGEILETLTCDKCFSPGYV